MTGAPEIGNLSRRIIRLEIKSVLKSLPRNKSPGLDGFPGKFYQTFKGELKLIILKLFENWKVQNSSKNILRGQHYPVRF